MANKNLFGSSTPKSKSPVATVVNHAGGAAYDLGDREKLAQMAIVGTLGNTFYTSAGDQLAEIISLCNKVPATFIGRTAIYARKHSFMKDTPALLCAILASKDVSVLKVVFPQVIDNGKMLRNFCQIIRSGKVGRKSFGTSVKKLINAWFKTRRDDSLFKDSVGNDPSIADVIKMAHPAPRDSVQAALFAYLIGKKVVTRKSDMVNDKHGRATTVLLSELPETVQKYEKFKTSVLSGKANISEIPDVEFRLLTALNLGTPEWTAIAKNAPWHATRMNLNTFLRQGVFNDSKMIGTVSDKLRDRASIEKSKVFPYQLLAAYKNVEEGIPSQITNALQDALEISTENIPTFAGKVYVCVDVSGSMGSPVTGNRGNTSSKVSCRDVAALVASAVLRKNPDAEVICFSDDVVPCRLNPRDSVVSNSNVIAHLPSGGTSCSAPIRKLNRDNAKGDLIIMVSDNESWRDMSNDYGTSAHAEWLKFKSRNPKARFVSIDVTPNTSQQVKTGTDVLYIGGFSDDCFTVIDLFANGTYNGGDFVKLIDTITLETSPVVDAAKAGVKKAIKKKS